MHQGLFNSLLLIAFGASLGLPAWAQEILPFPPKPPGSTAAYSMQQSIYSPLPAKSRLPEDAPNILIVLRAGSTKLGDRVSSNCRTDNSESLEAIVGSAPG